MSTKLIQAAQRYTEAAERLRALRSYRDCLPKDATRDIAVHVDWTWSVGPEFAAMRNVVQQHVRDNFRSIIDTVIEYAVVAELEARVALQKALEP